MLLRSFLHMILSIKDVYLRVDNIDIDMFLFMVRIYFDVHFDTKIQWYEIRGWGKGIHYEYKRGWALGLGGSLN